MDVLVDAGENVDAEENRLLCFFDSKSRVPAGALIGARGEREKEPTH